RDQDRQRASLPGARGRVHRLGGQRGAPHGARRALPALRGRGRGVRQPPQQQRRAVGPRRGRARALSRYDALKREILNLPNLITLGRLFLIPPVLVLIDPTDPIRNFIAALLFASASGLDILDGWLARRQNLVTV